MSGQEATGLYVLWADETGLSAGAGRMQLAGVGGFQYTLCFGVCGPCQVIITQTWEVL